MAKNTVHAPSPAFPMLAGMTAGLLAALTLSVLLAARGMPIAGAWDQLLGGAALQFASASVLWATAGLAFIVGAATSALLGKYPPPWRAMRPLRWLAGAAILFALSHVAHGVHAPEDVPAGLAVLADASTIVMTGLMALFGAFFTRPR